MDITVILPIHKYDALALEAIKSVKNIEYDKPVKLIVSTTQEVKEQLSDVDCEFVLVEEGESTSFQHLVNKAVERVDTEYFSVIELDDTFYKNVFKNAELYMNSDYDASLYLPLTEVVDFKTGEPIGYMNESVWSSTGSHELGYADVESTKDIPNVFNLTGGVFRKSDFIEVGGLKESMKYYFAHELMLRLLEFGKKVFVVPKAGYSHTIAREGSLFDELSKTMSSEEAGWWLDTANKEYLYNKDREKTFE